MNFLKTKEILLDRVFNLEGCFGPLDWNSLRSESHENIRNFRKSIIVLDTEETQCPIEVFPDESVFENSLSGMEPTAIIGSLIRDEY